jgi:hypothetical protein
MGVGPGDDVVVPSFTFYASAEAIAVIGANPVFCDIDPWTFCLTPDTVRAALTPETKVVMAVHLFGNVAPVDDLAPLGVPVLEDAAQAAGSRVADGRRAGTLGAAATFSFFPSKNLGAFGDGGAIATPDDELAEQVAMLRFHGSRDKVSFELVGHNSRLDELQAALLALALPRRTTRRPGSATSPLFRCPSTAATPPGTSTSSATRGRRRSARRSWRPGSAPSATTGRRCTARSRCAPGRTSTCRGPTRRRARTSRSR